MVSPMPRSLGFVLGLVTGVAFGSFGMLALLGDDAGAAWLAPGWMHLALATVNENLRGSVLPFLLVGLWFAWRLRALRRCLRQSDPQIDKVLRQEQVLDLCASLFFGIGVIWTAIGMRAALLHALGSPLAIAGESAYTVLQRLVDGGILLALSTTIVGGVGGYLMRVTKSAVVGAELGRLYLAAGREPLDRGLALLEQIAARLPADPEPGRP